MIVPACLLDGPEDVVLDLGIVRLAIGFPGEGGPSIGLGIEAFGTTQGDADVVATTRATSDAQPQDLLLAAAMSVQEDEEWVRDSWARSRLAGRCGAASHAE